MSRTYLALAAVTVTLGLAAGCSRNGESAGTTTIRSGTPGGVRVTGAPAPASIDEERAADRLAAALCEQQRKCQSAQREDMSTEAALLGEAVCVAELEPAVRRSVQSWRCSPAAARAGFEECLASIKTELRCRNILLGEGSDLRACRPSEICRESTALR